MVYIRSRLQLYGSAKGGRLLCKITSIFSFRLTLILFVAVNAVACFLLETQVAQSQLVKRIWHRVSGKKQPRNRFKIVLAEMEKEEGCWPPVTPSEDSTEQPTDQVEIRPGER